MQLNKAKRIPSTNYCILCRSTTWAKRHPKLLAEQINHVLDLSDWSREKFIDIKDIGPVVADNVTFFFFTGKQYCHAPANGRKR